MLNNAARMYLLPFNPGNTDSIEQQHIPLQMLTIKRESAYCEVPALYTEEVQRDPPKQDGNFIDSCIDSNDMYTDYVTGQEESHTYSNKQVIDYKSGSKSQPNVRKKSKVQHNETSTVISSDLTATYSVSGISVNIEKFSQLQGYVDIPDTVVQPRAIAVLPKALQLRRDGISPRRMLPARVRFGPVQGIKREISLATAQELVTVAVSSNKPIFINCDENDVLFHIDMSDKDKCNWLGLLPLGDQNSANVWLVHENNEVFGITVYPIPPRTKLSLGYTKVYADHHGIPAGQPILDHNKVKPLKIEKWWCHECQRSVSSAARLKRHVDNCHKEVKKRRRYRCQHCGAVFSGVFTLKRHMTLFCTKKAEKSDIVESTSISDAVKTVAEPNSISEIGLNTTLTMEDDRLPSDESFNNYTNGLDFSTNLFDTDRMPNLDISGSSRSETDLNPYGGVNKVDNEFLNGLELTKIAPETNKTTKTEMPSTFLCIHCKQSFHVKLKRRHIRECLRQKNGCHCGLRFMSKEKLAQHIFAEHPLMDVKSLPDVAALSSDNKDVNESSDISYGCEQCQMTFKRRGMLVNHLWRVHGSAADAVAAPLQRRDRVFPCVACPKLYRSAAKRAVHMRAHHPGADIMRAKWIESGRRACEPAACPECPRQYATRAKLLQHIRAHHPQLAPPKKKKASESVN